MAMPSDNKQKRVIVMAGGTGGHIFPAMAVADYLAERGVEIIWFGCENSMESRLVPEKGYKIEYLSAAGIRGKGIFKAVIAAVKMAGAVIRAVKLIRRYRPMAVIGMGGYVSAPGGIASWLLRKKLAIHEQNAVAGSANRMLSNVATRVFEAFPQTFAKQVGAVYSGNPIREQFSHQEKVEKVDGEITILVVGGSLGAQILNQMVPAALKNLKTEKQIKVVHQAGEKTLAEAVENYRDSGLDAEVVPFIKDMAGAYAAADIIICRAGALTVAEVAFAGRASIMVPLPQAIDDHQTKNAEFLSGNGAAILMKQSELTEELLIEKLSELIEDNNRRTGMAAKAKELAVTDATEKIAAYCLEEMCLEDKCLEESCLKEKNGSGEKI